MRALFDLLQQAGGEEGFDQFNGLWFAEAGKEAEGAERVELVFREVFGFGTDEHAGDHLLAEAAFGAGDAGEDDADGGEEVRSVRRGIWWSGGSCAFWSHRTKTAVVAGGAGVAACVAEVVEDFELAATAGGGVTDDAVKLG